MQDGGLDSGDFPEQFCFVWIAGGVVSLRGGKPDVKQMLRGIVTNPLIIASVIGILFYFLHIRLPYGVEKSVVDLGRVATPLSLVALGGSFTIGKVKDYTKQLLIGVLGRLVVVPAVMISLGILLGLRKELLIPVMIMFGAPTAVSSFPMAQQMGGDGGRDIETSADYERVFFQGCRQNQRSGFRYSAAILFFRAAMHGSI